MTTTNHELIKQHIDSFPILPITVTRLLKVTNNSESSVQDVMEVVLTDPSLCVTVLKIANSALYGRPKKVASINMAVSILGFNEVLGIAMAKALINSFSKLGKQHQGFIDRFWEHSFLCGIVARAIAQDLRITPDSAFMGGFIHDVGKLIMLEIFADDYELGWMTKFSDEEMLHDELDTFAFTHDTVGGQLLNKWLFPEILITAVEYHHHPLEAVNHKSFAAIIQLADLLSFYCCNRDSLGDEDIVTAIRNSLPEIQTQWQDFGLPFEDNALIEWFNWLTENYEEGCNLKEAFSS
jgi:putative nucleotidyltransferase with HDIG domain